MNKLLIATLISVLYSGNTIAESNPQNRFGQDWISARAIIQKEVVNVAKAEKTNCEDPEVRVKRWHHLVTPHSMFHKISTGEAIKNHFVNKKNTFAKGIGVDPFDVDSLIMLNVLSKRNYSLKIEPIPSKLSVKKFLEEKLEIDIHKKSHEEDNLYGNLTAIVLDKETYRSAHAYSNEYAQSLEQETITNLTNYLTQLISNGADRDTIMQFINSSRMVYARNNMLCLYEK